MKQGFLVPVYRHAATAGPLAEKLSAFGLPVILVDDGNDAESRACLAEWTARTPGLVLVSLKKNQGKGGAVIRGLEKAAEMGLTHVLQLDADGQHDIGKAAFFLEESAKYPDNIICAYPEFDASAPGSRVTGRKISNFWASLVTLSKEIKDVLCGFRVYPVQAVLRVVKNPFLDKRMGFDAEIMVRLYWKGVYPIYHPIKVCYPDNGVSNFRMFRDNVRISWVFTRLCMGMLIRLPLLMGRVLQKTAASEAAPLHWSRHREQAAGYWHVKFMLILFRLFPVIILRILAFPVGFFYFLFSKKGRTESKRFLGNAASCIDEPVTAKRCRSFFGPLRHIISFSLALVEKLESWGGKFSFRDVHFQHDDIGELIRDLENGRGVALITSHLGNIELLRGLASFNRTGVSRKTPVTAIIDMKVSEKFTRMLNELNPQSSLDIISVYEIGPHSAVLLEEKIAAGEMVTIAGDRTSAGSNEKSLMISFLGKEAPFSPGTFYLAGMMQAPVYFVFALRRKDLSLAPQYDMHVHKSSVSFDCSRKERLERSFDLARSFAGFLENYCKEKPFQWYNFYDFWAKGV